VVVPTATGRIIYVDADAIVLNNGFTWDDAYRYLQDALAAVDNADKVYADEGIYRPNRDRAMTRGDLNSDDGPNFASNSENSYHVAKSIECDETVVLDGFTITCGNADNADARPSEDRCGSGMYNEFGSLTLINCTFSSNGEVSAHDAGLIVQKAVGLMDKFPVEG
jgi:hypothetical protein